MRRGGHAFVISRELVGSQRLPQQPPMTGQKKDIPMATTAALVWYLVIAGPQGGMVVLPSTFDKREQCTAAITEYQKQPTPTGWSIQCVPSASPFTDEGDAEVPSAQ